MLHVPSDSPEMFEEKSSVVINCTLTHIKTQKMLTLPVLCYLWEARLTSLVDTRHFASMKMLTYLTDVSDSTIY